MTDEQKLQEELKILKEKIKQLKAKVQKNNGQVLNNGEVFIPIGYSGRRLKALESIPDNERTILIKKRIKNLTDQYQNYSFVADRNAKMAQACLDQIEDLEKQLQQLES